MNENLHNSNKETGFPEEILHKLPVWHKEVREFLPDLAQKINVNFNNSWLIPDYGTGGYALGSDTIELAFDMNFEDVSEQMKRLRGTYFHECYHLVQAFTGGDFENGEITALDNSIMEGAATKFEMIKANTRPGWGDYPKEEVTEWVELIKKLGASYDYEVWKFYNPKMNERWILYRTGSFIIDQALEKNPSTDIADLAILHPKQILELSQL